MALLTKMRSYESFFDSKLNTKKEQTRKLYRYSLEDFDRFCKKNLGKNLEASLIDFRKADTDSLIDMLQEWINSSKIYRQSNLKGRLYQINNYLRYMGIKIDIMDLKDLEFESSDPEERRPTTTEELRKIVNAASNRQRALILALSSSGMAIGEACNLIKSDFDYTQKRIQIHIKPSYTKKNGRGRTVFISCEAERFLKPILNKLEDHQRVFGYSNSVQDSINNYQNQYRRLVDGLGLGVKYDSGKRQKTLHALRAFFFTKAVQVNGLAYAHKMTGHKGYLLEYNRITEQEKLDYYLKLEPELFINERKPESKEIFELKKQVEELKVKNDKIDILQQRLDEIDNKIQESYELKKEWTEKVAKDPMIEIDAQQKALDERRKKISDLEKNLLE